MSAELPPPNSGSNNKNITFSRRYLDPNRVTYEVSVSSLHSLPPACSVMLSQFHTGKGNFSFDTPWGRAITEGLEQLAKTFDLSFEYGVAPHDFTLSRYAFHHLSTKPTQEAARSPYPSNDSVLSLMAEVRTILYFMSSISFNSRRCPSGSPSTTRAHQFRT